MRHGVFSVTKSLGGAVALLRLARLYGNQVFELKIKDYVAVTGSQGGVTLEIRVNSPRAVTIRSRRSWHSTRHAWRDII
jgi:hypothetical protein